MRAFLLNFIYIIYLSIIYIYKYTLPELMFICSFKIVIFLFVYFIPLSILKTFSK